MCDKIIFIGHRSVVENMEALKGSVRGSIDAMAAVQQQCKRVRTPVALLRSILDKHL